MTGMLRLSWRLARAGGRARWATVAVGSALVTVLGLAAQAVPAAMYPEGESFAPYYRIQFTVIIIACLFPAVGLLVTTARLSSDVRDRRLASLRLVGLTPARAAGIAGLEILWPALLGGLAGWMAFYPLAKLGDMFVALGPDWFASGLRVSPEAAALTVLAVVALCVVASVVPVRYAVRDPLPARKMAARRTPSPSRLLLLLPAYASLAWLAWMYTDPVRRVSVQQEAAWAVIFGGGACAVLAILLVPPVLTAGMARVLVRHPVTPRLAGRGLQVTPASVARQATGFGVMALLLLAVVGLSQLFLAIPDVRAGARALGEGPQRIALVGEAPLAEADLANLAQLPGVQHVVAVPDVGMVDWTGALVVGPPQIFVGTCEELALLVVLVEPCHYNGVARLGVPFGGDGVEVEYGVDGSLPFQADGAEVTVAGQAVTLPLATGAVYPGTLGYDNLATTAAWGREAIPTVFVPRALVPEAATVGAIVIADGGSAVADALEAWGTERALVVTRTNLTEFLVTQQALVTIWTLLAIAALVTLASFTISAIDRTREQRPRLVRLVALGVPGEVIRRAQMWQNLLGLLGATLVAIPAGLLLVPAIASLDPQQAPELPSYGPSLLALVLALAVAVLLSTGVASLAARVRLTPELLRLE